MSDEFVDLASYIEDAKFEISLIESDLAAGMFSPFLCEEGQEAEMEKNLRRTERGLVLLRGVISGAEKEINNQTKKKPKNPKTTKRPNRT